MWPWPLYWAEQTWKERHIHLHGLSREMNAVTPEHKCFCAGEISNHMGKGCNGRSSTRGWSRHQCTLRLDHIQRVLKNSCWLRESWVSFLSVQFSRSVLSDSLRPHGLQHARPPCPSPTPWTYSKLLSIESVMPSHHLILCCPFLLPSIFPSIRVFFNESLLPIRRPKCWSFSFSISPSNEYSGLISFRINWLALLAVQRTLKSVL